MRPLPVLILVLIAIAATVAALLLRSPTQTTPVVAPTPIVATERPAEDTTNRIATPVEETRADAAPATAPSDDEDDTIVNNRLTGLVLNDQEQPIPGATVKLSQGAMMGESIANDFFMGRETSSDVVLETTTDAKGAFMFRAVEPARAYYVMVVHSEYAAVQEEGIRIGKSGDYRAPDLVMHAGSRIFGVVVDVEGRSIAGATLDLDSAYMMGVETKSPDRVSTVTDANGNYEFRNVSAGARSLTCWADGFDRQISSSPQPTGMPDSQIQVDFRLAIGHPVGGRVFGPQDEGIEGATVIAMNFGGATSSRGEAVTDDQGNFQIMGLALGQYLLIVKAPGYRRAGQNRVQAGDLNVMVEMVKQNTLTGHVFEAGTRKPVSTYTVQVLRAQTAIPAQGNQLTNYEPTDVKQKVEGSRDGAFELIGVDPGTFALKISASGYASKITDNFSVVDGQMQPALEVLLSKGGSLKGRLVDAVTGKPVSGAQVSSKDGDAPGDFIDPMFEAMVATRATERKTRTNAEGFFELKLLNPGRYRLLMEHANYTTEWVNNLIVMEGQPTDAGSTSLHSGGSVSGKVVDGSGKPCARAQVRMYNEGSFDVLTARTDGEGRYTLEHIKPGIYKISAMRTSGAGGDAIDNLIDQGNSESQVQVFEGKPSSRDITLGN